MQSLFSGKEGMVLAFIVHTGTIENGGLRMHAKPFANTLYRYSLYYSVALIYIDTRVPNVCFIEPQIDAA
mgnify:CR=1 FL=1